MPLVEQRLRGLVYLTLELYRPLQKMMAGSIILFAPHVGAALRGRPWHKTSIDGQPQTGAPAQERQNRAWNPYTAVPNLFRNKIAKLVKEQLLRG